jgi:hypothetical protein
VADRDDTAPDVETASDDYARRFAGPVGEYFLEVQTRLVLSQLSPWPGASVLDVGGGHAQIAPQLVKHGFDVTVTGSTAGCRARLDRVLPADAFAFRRCDLLDLPWSAGAFDVVLALRLLPHVERWQRLLAEMCRVARRAVVVDYPDRRSVNVVQERMFAWKKAIERNTRPFRCFGRRELLSELAGHGFGSARLEPEFFAPMVVHRALGSRALAAAIERTAATVGLTARFGSPVILRVERLAPHGGSGS